MATASGVVPDIVTTAKGLGGGIVPNAALLMAPAIKDWFLDTDFHTCRLLVATNSVV